MSSNDQELAHRIKIKFGTSPYEPNQHQIERIKSDIQEIVRRGQRPTEIDWRNVVVRHCPSAGRHGYSGADNSDLITLLQLATKRL